MHRKLNKAHRPETGLLNSKAAARFLGVSERTLWGLAARGAIPRVRINSAIRYDLRDLLRFVERVKERKGEANANETNG